MDGLSWHSCDCFTSYSHSHSSKFQPSLSAWLQGRCQWWREHSLAQWCIARQLRRLSWLFYWSAQRGITVGGDFEAGECFLCVEVVTLSTGHPAGEEGISTVGLFVTPALITPETVTCRQMSASGWLGPFKTASYLSERRHLTPGGETGWRNIWPSCWRCSVLFCLKYRGTDWLTWDWAGQGRAGRC